MFEGNKILKLNDQSNF